MLDSAVILARRTPTDILLADGAAAVRCHWTGLASSDGAEISVEWTPRVVPVDSPADRELLAEHFLGAGVGATLSASATADHLQRTLVTPLRRAVAQHEVEALLRGDADVVLAELLQSEAKRAAFSVGLAILPPFVLRIESPSVERERRLAETRARLAAMHEMDGARARSISSLAQTLADLPDPQRAARVMADLHLGDPLDLLRAVAVADPAWSAAQPMLWIAAGDRVLAVDPTRPTLNAAAAIRVEGIGPLRSVRGDVIHGEPVLLVGGRGGVAMIDPAKRQVVETFAQTTDSEFGFNGVCVLPNERLILATHSALGLVGWDLETRSSRTIEWSGSAAPAAARSPVRCEGGAITIAFVGDGRVATYRADRGARIDERSPADVAELLKLDDQTLIALSGDGSTAWCDERALAADGVGTWSPTHARGCSSAAGITSIDLCATPRLVTIGADDRLCVFDPLRNADPLRVGTVRMGTRLVRGRPGFLAAVSADRSRIALIDLARPEAVASDLHVGVILGNRIADCWFA